VDPACGISITKDIGHVWLALLSAVSSCNSGGWGTLPTGAAGRTASSEEHPESVYNVSIYSKT
jgi:hypothetical protein